MVTPPTRPRSYRLQPWPMLGRKQTLIPFGQIIRSIVLWFQFNWITRSILLISPIWLDIHLKLAKVSILQYHQIEQKASPHQAQELQFTTLANPGKEASLPFTLVRKCIFSNVEGLCSRQVLSLECRIDSQLIRLTVQKFQFDWTTSSNWSVLWAYSKSWKET